MNQNQQCSGSFIRALLEPARLFVLLGLFSGLVLVFLLPPFQVADEWRHFYRVWQLAEGTLFGHGLGDEIPRELQRLTWETESRWGLPTRTPVPRAEALAFLRQMAALRIDPADALYVSFPTVLYAPIPYLAMSGAVALARLLTESPLLLMYAGRLGGLALALALTWYAIRTVPFGKWAFFLAAMTPVVAFQRAGMSADGFINGLAMLQVALVLELACRPGRTVTTPDLYRLGIVTLALCLCKQAYLFLPLFHFVVPADRFVRGADRRLMRYWLPLLGWTTAAWWAAAVMHENYQPMMAGTDAAGQLRWILGHPFSFLLVLGRDLAQHGLQYLHELIGTLGWLDLPAPQWLVLAHAGLLLAAALADGPPRGWLLPRQRRWAASTLTLSLVFVWTLMYLWWAPVGAPGLPGMQGRYFAPLLPLLLVAAAVRPHGGIAADGGAVRPGLCAGFWPLAAGGYGLFLTLETLLRTAAHHYR